MKKHSFFLLWLWIIAVLPAFGQSSGLPEKAEDIAPMLIGETLPNIELTSAKGIAVKTGEIFKGKTSVLIVYRGGWCPYCNKHLSALQEIEQELIDLGLQIIAISPDAPAQLSASAEKNDLKYQLYSDSKGEFIKLAGIAFQAPERYAARLLEVSENENKGWLPVPSVFFVDGEGKILFEYIQPNYQHRMSGDLLLAVADALMMGK